MPLHKTTVQVPVERIRDVIGPGGATIRSVMERTQTRLSVHDDGRIEIEGSHPDAVAAAARAVQNLVA